MGGVLVICFTWLAICRSFTNLAPIYLSVCLCSHHWVQFHFHMRLGSNSCTNSALVSYFCTTNYHKINSLEQYAFIISQFRRSEVCHGIAGFAAQDLTRPKSSRRQNFILLREFWGRIKLLAVGRIQPLVIVALRSWFLWHVAPSTFKPPICVASCLCFKSLTSLIGCISLASFSVLNWKKVLKFLKAHD